MRSVPNVEFRLKGQEYITLLHLTIRHSATRNTTRSIKYCNSIMCLGYSN